MALIFVTALICGLIQMVQHWFPWRMALGGELHRVLAYVLGVLGIVLPLTVLYWNLEQTRGLHVLALWACVTASGMAVMGAYGLDWLLNRVRKSYEHEELDNAKAGREQ